MTKLNHLLHPLLKLLLLQLVQQADLAWRKKQKIASRPHPQNLEKSLRKDRVTFLQQQELLEFSRTTAKAQESAQEDKILSERLQQTAQADSKDNKQPKYKL